MKNLMLSLLLLISTASFSQTANKLFAGQAAPTTVSPYNFVYIDTTGVNTLFRVARIDSILRPVYDLVGTKITAAQGSILFKPVGYVPSWADITGKPVTKRYEPYSGVTNGSGIVTFTYASAFPGIPNVQYNIGVGGTNKQTVVLQTSTTTGCTLLVQVRTDVLGLLPSYSAVNGSNVDIQVMEK